MASKLYVAEYPSLAATEQSDSVAVLPQPPTAEQTVDYSAGVTATANAFRDDTNFVQISTDSICSIAFGTTPVATVANQRLAANEKIIVGVRAGSKLKVSAITNT